MPVSTSNQVTLEKSPFYISDPEALYRIRAMNSSIMVMVIVREPITRLLSAYSHYLSVSRVFGKDVDSFEKHYIPGGKISEHNVLKWGNYADRMEYVYSVFSNNNHAFSFLSVVIRKQVLLLDGDKFVSDPLSQLRRVERFLGIRQYFSEEDVYFDKRKGFYCYKLRDNSDTKCMDGSKGRHHVEVDPDVKEKLLNFLKPYTNRFLELTGEKFDWDV
ncbi:heparan sulfate glucosamine 3-O-sulfotransferase 5 [Aplysia californica]|uniref:Heparan sulfate glucosamine 3-O-sulfotransferase 5 n=1 Tax=Aplysia californica TaxID=6500 RepID=A0ABM1VPU0_APLCA|nr:heparan sulfate glucosamine 3-O-sulfotransferase 5 [Aplysia californica]